MTHSTEEMIGVIRAFYPRGMLFDDPGYKESNEHRRLVAARRKAGAEDEAWRAALRRLEGQFPTDNVINRSLGLSTGGMDAAYSCQLVPAASAEGLTIGFLVSFLVPYYVVYCSRTVVDVEKTAAARSSQDRNVCVFVDDTCFIVPAGIVKPEIVAQEEPVTIYRSDVSFDLSAPEVQPYAAWVTHEIEATWGYESMPPEIGKIIVPDVSTNLRALGEATLYDCLFADDWLI